MGKNKGLARGSEEPVPALDPEHLCAGGVNGDDQPHFPSRKTIQDSQYKSTPKQVIADGKRIYNLLLEPM